MRILCLNLLSVQSVQSHLTLDPRDCSTPSIPVHHQLLDFAQMHVIELVMPSNILILCCPLLLPPSIFPSIRVFSNESALLIRWQSIGVFAWASVLPMNIQDWFPLGLTGLSPCSPGDSQESSSTPQFKSINSLVLSFLYGPTLTSIHDYWKNHSFDETNLCWQNDVSAF